MKSEKRIFTGCHGLMELRNSTEWYHKALGIGSLTCAKCGTAWNLDIHRALEVLLAQEN